MKCRIVSAIIQAVLLATKAVAVSTGEHELEDRDNSHCEHMPEHINHNNHADAYSKHTKHHQPTHSKAKSGTKSKSSNPAPAAYTNIRSEKTKSSVYKTSAYSTRDSNPTFTSDSVTVTSSTTSRTSSQSTSTSTTSTIRPLATLPVCPIFDGYCLGTGFTLPPLIYLRCGRSLADDVTTSFDCVPQPSLTYEGQCNEACFNDATCKAWSGSYEVPGVGFPNGTYDCCHVYEQLALQPDLPPPLDPPFDPFSGSSYGVRGVCPLGSTGMCPYYDSQCVEGIQVHCGPALSIVTDSNTGVREWTFDSTEYFCHQSCVEDPTCTAWDGFQDFGDPEFGGARSYYCYHYNTTIVLNPNIPPGKSSTGFGVKGC